LLEAMSQGLAIVTLDHQGAHDFVPEEAGIKVRVGTPYETTRRLAEAIESLYHSPEILMPMSKTGLAFARLHEWSLKAERVTQLYETVFPIFRREPIA
jgi:glycosyltransferase involved in cell wall biosynthesis